MQGNKDFKKRQSGPRDDQQTGSASIQRDVWSNDFFHDDIIRSHVTLIVQRDWRLYDGETFNPDCNDVTNGKLETNK